MVVFEVFCTIIRFAPFQRHALKDYFQNRILLGSITAAGGHFVWDIMIKHFYNPSKNNAILYDFSIILPDFHWYRSKQDFLTFLVVAQIKQGINSKKDSV